MPQFELALLSFGKLIGLVDTTGSFRWTWFGDPLVNSFTGMAANRAELGLILRAMLDRPPGDSPPFDAASGLRWEALSPFTGAEVGFVWNENVSDALQIGLGASTEIPIAEKELALSVLARLLKITTAGDPSAELGTMTFSGAFPVPDFLQAGAIAGTYDPATGLTLSLTAQDADGSRVLSFATPPSPAAVTALPWDVARLATFVLRAWLRQEASDSPVGPPKSFLRRIDDHLWPMLGDPPSAIQPFPLLADAMGTVPSFDAWRGSILTADANGTAALTFLWHLRALVTGNTSPNILPGSRYLALVAGPEQAAGTPPPAAFTVAGSYPPVPPVAGAWLGVRVSPQFAGQTELVIDLRNGQAGAAGVRTIILLRRGAGFTLPDIPLPDFNALVSFLPSVLPLTVGSGQITFQQSPDGSIRLCLIGATIATGGSPLDGEYLDRPRRAFRRVGLVPGQQPAARHRDAAQRR